MHEVEVDIDACPEHVWAVLADVARWPEWARGVVASAATDGGPLVVGGRVRVRARRQGTRTWRVTALTPYRGFTWCCASTGSTDTLTVALRSLDGDDDPTAAPGRRGSAGHVRRTRLSMTLARTGPGAGLAALRPGGTRAASAAHVGTLAADLRERCERRRSTAPASRPTRPVAYPA